MKRSKDGLFVFPPKKTLIWRSHCSIDQSCCSMTSKPSIDWFLESSSGVKFFQASVRAFVSVRQSLLLCKHENQNLAKFSSRKLIALIIWKLLKTFFQWYFAGDVDQWCNDRNSMFPIDLMTAPPPVVKKTTVKSVASGTLSWNICLVLLLCFLPLLYTSSL